MLNRIVKIILVLIVTLISIFLLSPSTNAQTCSGYTAGSYTRTTYSCGDKLPGETTYHCVGTTNAYPGSGCFSGASTDNVCGFCHLLDQNCVANANGCTISNSTATDSNCASSGNTWQACGTSGGGNPGPTVTCHDCSYYGATCGSITNNCGQSLSCGSCSGYTCSGCNQQNYACSNNKCVAQTPGTPSSNCNSACSGTTVCAGCMLTNTTCNASGQCVANSSAGQTASSQCNSNCTGTWTNSSGQTCGQTCNSSGTCVNNSSTCTGCTKPDGTACSGQCQSATCNGSTCQTQGWYCSNSTTCSCGWAGGTTVAGTCPSNCPSGSGPTPTPAPTGGSCV